MTVKFSSDERLDRRLKVISSVIAFITLLGGFAHSAWGESLLELVNIAPNSKIERMAKEVSETKQIVELIGTAVSTKLGNLTQAEVNLAQFEAQAGRLDTYDLLIRAFFSTGIVADTTKR